MPTPRSNRNPFFPVSEMALTRSRKAAIREEILAALGPSLQSTRAVIAAYEAEATEALAAVKLLGRKRTRVARWLTAQADQWIVTAAALGAVSASSPGTLEEHVDAAIAWAHEHEVALAPLLP